MALRHATPALIVVELWVRFIEEDPIQTGLLQSRLDDDCTGGSDAGFCRSGI
jgi:hypothetical protein